MVMCQPSLGQLPWLMSHLGARLLELWRAQSLRGAAANMVCGLVMGLSIYSFLVTAILVIISALYANSPAGTRITCKENHVDDNSKTQTHVDLFNVDISGNSNDGNGEKDGCSEVDACAEEPVTSPVKQQKKMAVKFHYTSEEDDL